MLIKYAGNTNLGKTGLEFKTLQIHEKKAAYNSENESTNFPGNTNCKSENDKMVLEIAGKVPVAVTTHKPAMSQSYQSTTLSAVYK